MLIIVGSIIIPSSIDAVRMFMPVPPKISLIIGTITIKAKNPYTIDGMPAIKFIPGFNTLYNFLLQNLARYMAVKTPMGTPIIMAPRVT